MPTHDLVADHGGVADGQRQTVSASITSGAAVLVVETAIFASGDAGKSISLTASGFFLRTTILTFTSSTQVTLAANAPSTLSSVSTDILWGTDNAAAFADFNAWAVAQVGLVTLTAPAGRFCFRAQSSNRPFSGVPLIKFQGASKLTTIISQLGQGQLYFGGSDPIAHAALTHVNGNSARIYTAYKGASTLRLKDVSYASKITVGRIIKITGYDTQGLNASAFGYPPNPFVYEDNTPTDVTSDIITLATPLRHTYKDTWPNWNSGSASEADPGGPATIYMPGASYNTEVELNDFTIDNPNFQSVAHGKRVVMNRVLCTGNADVSGMYPTQNDYFEANDVDWTACIAEFDKINREVVLNNCAFGILKFQSASPDVCTITGGSARQVVGAPKRLIIDGLAFGGAGGSDARFQVGATGFGRTDEVIITNCTGLKTLAQGGASMSGIEDGGASTTMTMTAGVISFAKTDNDGGGFENPTRGFVPDSWLLLDNRLIVRVTDVYEDGTNVYIATNLTGTWPFTVTSITTHPAPRFTMRSCTGTAPELEDWNQAPAGIPLYSYSKRTYVAGATAATPATSRPTLYGRFVTAKFNVTDDYVAGALTFKDSQSNNRNYEKLSDYTTASDFAVTINMVTTGERVIRAATTATGSQSGDTLMNLTTPGQIWLFGSGNSFPVFSANVSNGETPTISVEFTMDQGITPSAITPLRMRLRAA